VGVNSVVRGRQQRGTAEERTGISEGSAVVLGQLAQLQGDEGADSSNGCAHKAGLVLAMESSTHQRVHPSLLNQVQIMQH
jgi:hypothetical protein